MFLKTYGPMAAKIDYKLILSESTDTGILANIFYKLLVKGNYVSYEDVALSFLEQEQQNKSRSPHQKEKYQQLAEELRDGLKMSALPFNNDLKRAIANVVNLFNSYDLFIEKYTKNRKSFYRYNDGITDPLHVLQLKAHIIDLRAHMLKVIDHKIPVRIKYKPFDRNVQDLVFHPHILKEYNRRTFVFGVSVKKGKEPLRGVTIALDRIQGNIGDAPSGTKFIDMIEGEYDFLKHIVGVSTPSCQESTTITLRLHDKKAFGRIVTKPLHYSQRISSAFDEQLNYGEVQLDVIPTVELQSQLLGYGSFLEVIAPVKLRKEIHEEIARMLGKYGN